MSDAITDYLELVKPEVGASDDTWGGKLNADLDLIDAAIQSLVEAHNYAAASGVDTIAVTLDPAPSAYAAGLNVRFKAAGANTAAPTLNVNGLGAKSVKYADGSSPAAGALVADVIYAVDYNGTDFILGNQSGPASAADTLAGTSALKFLTAAGLAGNKLLAADGYYRFPGGFTVMWGDESTSITGESTQSVTFPATFATACAFAIAFPLNPGASSGNDGFFQLIARSTTGASFRAQDVGGTLSGFVWLALGY